MCTCILSTLQALRWYFHLATTEIIESWYPPLPPSPGGTFLLCLSWKQLGLDKIRVALLWVYLTDLDLTRVICSTTNVAAQSNTRYHTFPRSGHLDVQFQHIVFEHNIHEILVFVVKWRIPSKPFQKVLYSLLGCALGIGHTYFSIT